MFALAAILDNLIEIYIWVIILSAVMSWLVAFDIINLQNRFIYGVCDMLARLTEPLYRRIRRFLPDMGGIDLSPIIVILGLMVLRSLVWRLV